MKQARWNQLEDLLQAALDRGPDERAEFVRHACGDDDSLRRELEALLAGESEGAMLESPAIALVAPQLAELYYQGRTISHYRIDSRIGSGGMGEVYKARDERLQRVVALKTLPAEFTMDPERIRRFEQEALAASRLNHPNIVTIFEVLHDGHTHLIATEHIEGQTLRRLLTERRIGTEQALDIAIQIATALKAAHTAWIIHRDIKPENIMVRSDGLVKVLDFGIAKLNEETANVAQSTASPTTRPDLTVPGSILGTASYMSPEQARGDPLDGRTDLFSLGLIFYEMLSGERFFAGATRDEVLQSIKRRDEPLQSKAKIDHLPKDLQPVIRKMLRANRDERYSSAAELIDDLQRARRRLESRPARRMVGLSAVAAIGAVALAAIAALLSVNETWEERVLRDGHTAAARQAAFSPDGRLLVSCGEDGRVIVWDFARRQFRSSLLHPAHKVAFSPDGRWLATGGMDGRIIIWDTRTWNVARILRGPRSEIGGLLFSPDSMLLAAAGSSPNGRTVVWDTGRWQTIKDEPSQMQHGTFVFSRDRKQFLGSSGLTLFDLRRQRRVSYEPLRSVSWIARSPDGRLLAAVDSEGYVSFYRLPRDGTLEGLRLIGRQQAHQDHGRAVAFSPDGRLAASGSEDVVLWDAITLEKLARFEYTAIVWSVAFSPDGRWLVSTHGDGAVLVWDVAERERVASFNEHSGAVRAVAFAPDGRRVATAGEDRSIILWDSLTGRKEAVLLQHRTRVTALAFSGDGRELGSADQSGVAILWDLAKRQPRFTTRFQTPAYSLTLSPDGRFVGTSRALLSTGGEVLLDFDDRLHLPGQVYGASFSPDGRRLACVTDGGRLLLIDTENRRQIAHQSIAGTHQITVSVSPEGRWLATGEDEGAVRLWTTEPLRQVAILGRHAARVKSVAFAPDGKTVASAGDDKMIALWDVRRRKLRAKIGTHASPVYSIAFSPDGRQLVSGEHDRSVRLYTRRRTLWGMRLE